MTRIADAATRRAALDTRKSFIVRAPAGAGKTALLIQRYLALLATVDLPEQVVAITFTVKAAAEMKARVLEAMAAARADPPEGGHERLTWELAHAVLGRDREREWRIAAQPSRLAIQTIDSLCLSLVRRMTWSSRLGADLALVEDATPHYRRAAHEVFGLLHGGDNPWQNAIGQVLRLFDNDVPRFEGLIVDMLGRRDQWLRHMGHGEEREARRTRLEAGLGRAVTDALVTLRDSVPAAIAPDIAALEGAAELPGTDASSLARWRQIADRLLTRRGTTRARIRGGAGSAGEAAERTKRLACVLAGEETFRQRLHAVRLLPEPAYEEQRWRVLDALCDVLRVAAAMLRLEFRASAEMDFIELAGAALTALGEPDTPTELALALDYRIAHVLVDEFQDTSHTQLALLERLTAGFEPGDGRTVFLVGDPMQSIYRFREADVGLYLEVRDRGLRNMVLTPLTLAANFRSQAAIVGWVNDTFPAVLGAGDDASTGAVAYTASSPTRGGHRPGVSVHCLFDDDGRGEGERVRDIVAGALAEDQQASVAVLVRSRAHLRWILPELRRASIAYTGADIDPLDTVPVVQDLLSLTRAIVFPADSVAWLAVLRAPWCGLTLADLVALIGSADGAVLPWEAMQDAARLGAVSEDGQQRLERVRDVMHRTIEARGRCPLRDLVEHTWLQLGGPACVQTVDLDNAAALLDLIETADRGVRTDLDRLCERVAGRYAAAPDADARVNILTIHNAKGLEFDTVIVPSLARGTAADAYPLLQWAERVARPGCPDLLIAPHPGHAANGDPVYDYLRTLEATRAHHEAARLLYVAATRARERLHLLGNVRSGASGGPPGPPRKNTLLGHLWPVLSEAFERAAGARAASNVRPGVAAPPPPTCLRRVPAGWCCPAPPSRVGSPAGAEVPAPPPVEVPVEFDWARATARHVGSVVHRMLRRIAEDGVNAWSPGRLAQSEAHWRVSLSTLGVPRAALAAATRRVGSALQHVLDDPRGRWILDPAHDAARCEYALSTARQGRVLNAVIDRTFVDAGIRWIIDYKTGFHEGAGLDAFLDRERERYTARLEHYASLVHALDPRPVRVGLYFPMHRAWREWSPGKRGRSP